ncbi:ABC-2 type transport system ATP-binding protein [Leucobacter exalbidus]|uniref:ABC-2 type transport system ATP-binding protein n=1 Tax=Leucobacter exalbidus TaxID=662960 RepID=A0A940T3Y1_9MICO|nr:ABC-2 type transport system ATP-binding protein [Leucobacter exalbidus]
MSHAIEVSHLSKSFGEVHAVRDLNFTAQPGRVTGFLGPNGSGKTTTLSMLLGLAHPDAGTATIGGMPYAQLDRPALTVGAALSANFHAAHTGRAHLDIARRAIGAPETRVAEVLGLVGLSDSANRKAGGYSLGMRQRLALATALLGDPDVLVLDEPVNGLDPEGIRWIRLFLRHLASEGKTVLLSSHLLSEAQHTVDDLVVIRRGELMFAGPLNDLQSGARTVFVNTAAEHRAALVAALTAAGGTVGTEWGKRRHAAEPVISTAPIGVTGLDADQVGLIAFAAGVALSHLSAPEAELELSFLELTGDAADTVAEGARS